jgi:hypothetical protein
VLLAFVREQGNGTAPFFYAFAAVTLVLAIAAWVVRPPVRTARIDSEEEEGW